MSDHLDDQISPEYVAKMRALAQVIDEYFNEGVKGQKRETGFVILVFPFGDVVEGGRCNYISNGADRKEIVTLMREMIARFEGQPEIKGTA